MAIGQQLLIPENGWNRYNDDDSNISYNGFSSYSVGTNNQYFWNNNTHRTIIKNSTISFNFTGSKIRIINQKANNMSNNITIKIDNISYSFSEYVSSGNPLFIIVFEKTDLLNQEHSCQIISNDTNLVELDAIDIDVTKVLKPYNTDLIKYLIKQNLNYYTIKSTNYDSVTTHNFIPLNLIGGTIPNKSDIVTFGFNDLSVLTNSMTVDSDVFVPISKFDNTAELKLYKLN